MLLHQTQQRPSFILQGQQINTTQGSVLITQLTTPPSSMPAGVNQFGQSGSNIPMQQQQLRINMLGNQSNQQNVQTSVPQNVQSSGIGQNPGIVTSNALPRTSNPSQVAPPNQVVTLQAQGGSSDQPSQQMQVSRVRCTIWQGLLEWIEKPKNSSDPQNVNGHVPCQVSANAKDGEPELKADGWPSKLIMQLMSKQLIENIDGVYRYLKNSKSVLFHPQNCEALESLTKVMRSGFAGCVHFTSIPNPNACDIKVLILLYFSEKRAYIGFIPNDQAAFVDRLNKAIQQQKSTQMVQQGQALPGGAAGSNLRPQVEPSGMSGAGTPRTVSSQSQTTAQQQGLMMSQTNTIAMGDGQITQNIVTSSSPSGAGIAGVLSQNIPGGMQPRIRTQDGVYSESGTENSQDEEEDKPPKIKTESEERDLPDIVRGLFLHRPDGDVNLPPHIYFFTAELKTELVSDDEDALICPIKSESVKVEDIIPLGEDSTDSDHSQSDEQNEEERRCYIDAKVQKEHKRKLSEYIEEEHRLKIEKKKIKILILKEKLKQEQLKYRELESTIN